MICFKDFFHKGKSTLKKYMQSRNFCLFDLFYMWLGLLFLGRKLAEDHKLIVRVSSSQMRVLYKINQQSRFWGEGTTKLGQRQLGNLYVPKTVSCLSETQDELLDSVCLWKSLDSLADSFHYRGAHRFVIALTTAWVIAPLLAPCQTNSYTEQPSLRRCGEHWKIRLLKSDTAPHWATDHLWFSQMDWYSIPTIYFIEENSIIS